MLGGMAAFRDMKAFFLMSNFFPPTLAVGTKIITYYSPGAMAIVLADD